MSMMVIFGGHVSGEAANAQHVLHTNVTYNFNSIGYNITQMLQKNILKTITTTKIKADQS